MLSLIRQTVKVPITLMSGTLTKPMIGNLTRLFKLNDPIVIAVDPTFDNWDQLEVLSFNSKSGSHFAEQVFTNICNKLGNADQSLKKHRSLLRVLVLLPSINAVNQLLPKFRQAFKSFEIFSITSQTHDEEFDSTMEVLLNETFEQNLFVLSTSALSVGANLKLITHVFCCGSYSLLEMVQGFGRGGRNDSSASVCYFSNHQMIQAMQLKNNIQPDVAIFQELSNYVTDVSKFRDVLGFASVVNFVNQSGCIRVYLRNVFSYNDHQQIECETCSGCLKPQQVFHDWNETIEESASNELFPDVVNPVNYILKTYIENAQFFLFTEGSICLVCQRSAPCRSYQCEGLKRLGIKTHPKACNFCLEIGHFSNDVVEESKNGSFNTGLVEKCCYVTKETAIDVCPFCIRMDCNKVGGCDTFATYRNVLFAIWLIPSWKQVFVCDNPEVAPFSTFKQFYHWAVKCFFFSGEGKKHVNMVKVMSFFFTWTKNAQVRSIMLGE